MEAVLVSWLEMSIFWDRYKGKVFHLKLWGLPKHTAFQQSPAVLSADDFHMKSRCKSSSLAVGLNPKQNLGSKEGHVLAIQNRKKNSHAWWRNVRAEVSCQGTRLQTARDSQALYLCIYFLNAAVGFPNHGDRLIKVFC